jgi:Carbon starvation protein CstA
MTPTAALSGWHALIASGTTPKMIENEQQIPFIGYGAMLMESFVAIMAMVRCWVRRLVWTRRGLRWRWFNRCRYHRWRYY